MKYAKIIGELEKLLSRERIFENEPMRKHTTIRIGGAADVFVLPLNAEELVNTVALCKKLAVPFTVLGNGSNVVVSDDGVEGVVISTSHMENKYRLTADGKLTVPSGARLAQMAQFARDRSLAGLEFAYGIPGTAGGAVYMNSGAYNREISNIVESVSCIDINGSTVKLSADECKFGYRKSVFQGTEYVITEVTLQLTQGNKELINSTMENNMQSRKEKQPLEFPSAGSVFKRPPNNFAGKLIEEAELKGKTVGGAQVSRKHAGFIVNCNGTATCKDFDNLVDIIKETVASKSGVVLECEVIRIGRK